jgi:hypothetical protein
MERGAQVFGDLLRHIQEADLTVANLETPLCMDATPIPKSGPNLRANPECANALRDAGFGAITLANNHIMDQGPKGLLDTMSALLRRKLPFCGAGRNLHDAQRHILVECQGIRVALISIAEHEFSIASTNSHGAAPLDPIDNLRQIEDARKESDIVVVSLHGGNEHFPYPRPGLRRHCRFLIDRGADAVICHHTHVPSAYEIYQGKFISYGLGNAIFDHGSQKRRQPPGWDAGYAVELKFDRSDRTYIGYNLLPYSQSVELNGICLVSGSHRDRALDRYARLAHLLADEQAYWQNWNEFVESRRDIALLRHFMPFTFRGDRRLSEVFHFGDVLTGRSERRLAKLNVLNCESHLELLQYSIQSAQQRNRFRNRVNNDSNSSSSR